MDGEQPAACTTVGCEWPGTVTGTFWEGDGGHRVTYCAECAELVSDVFEPDTPPRSRPAEPTVDGLAELEALRAEVVELRAKVAAQDTEIRRLWAQRKPRALDGDRG